jgi:hypothetical protein
LGGFILLIELETWLANISFLVLLITMLIYWGQAAFQFNFFKMSGSLGLGIAQGSLSGLLLV